MRNEESPNEASWEAGEKERLCRSPAVTWAQRDWDFCEQVVPRNKSYCKREIPPGSHLQIDIDDRPVQDGPACKFGGESREGRQCLGFPSLLPLHFTTPSLSFIFHLAFFLSDLPECRLRVHKESPSRPVTVSPRETPFAFFSSKDSHLPRLIRQRIEEPCVISFLARSFDSFFLRFIYLV